MKNERIKRIVRERNQHATYVMMSSFRILDNHALYIAMKDYKSFEVVILRLLEDDIQNQFFNTFLHDFMTNLSQYCSVKVIYDKRDIPFDKDVIIDKGYLREKRDIEQYVIDNSKYTVTVVESNVTVPVEIVSNKEEYSARTIRPKIFKHIYDYIDPVLDDFSICKGEESVLVAIEDFIENKIQFYHLKNHPELDYTSGISTYLKYGMISPIRILMLLNSTSHINKESFIDELIIRRELSFNFVYFNLKYSDFNHMTYDWAYKTMEIHEYDYKEYLYEISDYIDFKTHDKYFNAAMKEMIYLGKMHGYMRMYWCKKIIEWSKTFKEAFDTAIYLNNKYFLDGNTPNGYAGVAWCFGKHDRAWGEREIFGKLRYMNANGLKRKFEIDKYIAKVEGDIVDSIPQSIEKQNIKDCE